MTCTPNGPLLTAKLKIMERAPYIKKTGRIQKSDGDRGPNYTFASERDLLKKIRPLLIEYGITVNCVSAKSVPAKTGGGKDSRVVEAVYRFTHVKSGEYEDQAVLGEGVDSGDKGAPKCMTGAMKYAIRQWIYLETGDDPDKPEASDAERVAKGIKRINATEDAATLASLMKQIEADRDSGRMTDGMFRSLAEGVEKRRKVLVGA